eukprot:10800697-Lingulodinium_polyedra.AAC.1
MVRWRHVGSVGCAVAWRCDGAVHGALQKRCGFVSRRVVRCGGVMVRSCGSAVRRISCNGAR